MCLIRFAAATDEEKISYVSLYSYFHSRKRCGVIGNCYSGVKDMYLIPLASHQPVPPELLPFKGPGEKFSILFCHVRDYCALVYKMLACCADIFLFTLANSAKKITSADPCDLLSFNMAAQSDLEKMFNVPRILNLPFQMFLKSA